jgi:hypothetical protein
MMLRIKLNIRQRIELSNMNAEIKVIGEKASA